MIRLLDTTCSTGTSCGLLMTSSLNTTSGILRKDVDEVRVKVIRGLRDGRGKGRGMPGGGRANRNLGPCSIGGVGRGKGKGRGKGRYRKS